jgi:hypothetical protein
MALSPIAPVQKKKKGGFLGSLGTVLGGVAGAVIGGPAGAATGASLGGTAGGLIDPAKGGGGGRSVPLSSVAKVDPNVQLAQLVDARDSAMQLPKTQQQEVLPRILPAIEELKKRRV